MKNIIWSNNRVQSIMQMCMSRCTTANFSSCWFYFHSIFFLNLFSLFYFQYYEPLVFWPPFQLNFQNGPEIIFSCLACHSRPSVHPSLFLVLFFNTRSIYHTSVTSRLDLCSLLSYEIYSFFKAQNICHLSHIVFFWISSQYPISSFFKELKALLFFFI